MVREVPAIHKGAESGAARQKEYKQRKIPRKTNAEKFRVDPRSLTIGEN